MVVAHKHVDNTLHVLSLLHVQVQIDTYDSWYVVFRNWYRDTVERVFTEDNKQDS